MKNATLSYKKAVKRLSEHIAESDMNAFKGSTALAVIFDKDKHEALDDLMEYRKKNLTQQFCDRLMDRVLLLKKFMKK